MTTEEPEATPAPASLSAPAAEGTATIPDTVPATSGADTSAPVKKLNGPEYTIGLLLVALALITLYLLVKLWPETLADGSVKWNEPITLFKWNFAISGELRVLLTVMTLGALGGFIHAAQSFATFVGNQTFTPRWGWWYLLRPFIGAALAAVFYLLMRGGLLAGLEVNITKGIPYGMFGIAALVGLFSKQAADMMANVANIVFTADGDKSRKNKSKDEAGKT
jgi:hypothetical protein